MISFKFPADQPFSSHVQTDGSGIGGVPPAAYSITPIPGKHPSWLMQTEGNTEPGSQWPAVMFYPAVSSVKNAQASPCPILPNTGKLQLCFDQYVSAGGANVYETDTILVIAGFKYNLSEQRHAVTGQIDVGNWTDTGLRLGLLSPNEKHKIVITYEFDAVKKTSSVVSYECDGVSSPITVLQNAPATACNWPDGAYAQFQLGSVEAGTAWAQVIGNIRYRWS